MGKRNNKRRSSEEQVGGNVGRLKGEKGGGNVGRLKGKSWC